MEQKSFFRCNQRLVLLSLVLLFLAVSTNVFSEGILVKTKNAVQEGELYDVLFELGNPERVSLEQIDAEIWYISDDIYNYKVILQKYADLFLYFEDNLNLLIDPTYILVPGTATKNKSRTNDPYFEKQWYLQDIGVEPVWDIMSGINTKVKVALIGTGVNMQHPDLIGCFTDDGINLITDTTKTTTTTDLSDENDHETAVCGIIAANRDNEIGIAGIAAGNVEIMVIKTFDADGYGATGDVVRAILYAVDNGAKIINASCGNLMQNSALKDAIQYAEQNNVLFVTSAGNSSYDEMKEPVYPAAYIYENIISVTSSGQSGNFTDFACYHTVHVDMAAPGINMITTNSSADYGNAEGTSMAAAVVTAAAALIWAKYPDLTFEEVKMKLMQGTVYSDDMNGKSLSEGRLDIYKAITTE